MGIRIKQYTIVSDNPVRSAEPCKALLVKDNMVYGAAVQSQSVVDDSELVFAHIVMLIMQSISPRIIFSLYCLMIAISC